MKNILRNIIFSLIVGTIFYITSTIPSNQNKIIGLDDGLRHLTYSNIINKYGPNIAYEKYNLGDLIPNSILNTYKTDLWQGFHYLLVGLIKIGFSDLQVLKAYYSLTFAIILFVILTVCDRLKLHYIFGLGIFVLFILNEFIFRIFLARPFMISVILYGILILILHLKKYIYIIPILILGIFLHSVFYLLFFPIILYLLYYRFNRKTTGKIILYSFIGFSIGVSIHYNSLNYLILSFLHTFAIPYIQIKEGFGSGEAQGISFNIFFSLSVLLPASLLLSYFFIGYAKIKEQIFTNNKDLNFLIIHCILLLILMGFYGRFIDYYTIVMYFCIPFLVHEIIIIGGIDINKYINKKILIGTLILLPLFCISLVDMFYDKSGVDIKKLTNFIKLKKQDIKEGSYITTYKHLQFPILFYALGENYKYNCSMEPIFFYMKDKDLFLKYKDTLWAYLFKPKKYKEFSQYDILKTYNNNYLVHFGNIDDDSYATSELLKTKIEKINNDNRFSLISKDQENYLREIR